MARARWVERGSQVMKPCVVTKIPRPAAGLTHDLAQQGVATVHEGQGRRGLMHHGMRPIREGWSICGPAVTSLNHPGDNLMVHAALDVCQPGDVLVIATTVPCICGVLGELLAGQAKVRGLAGLVIDTGVRDVAALRQLGLPIWSAAISAAGAVKATPGWVNVPVVCGGTIVEPGDLLVADDDGVVVVPHNAARTVLDAANARTNRETASRVRYDAGEISMDVNNLREVLAKQGVTYL